MTDRTYRALVGLALLVGLFFDSPVLVYALVMMMFVEGVTNFRVPQAACRLLKCVNSDNPSIEYIPDYANPDYKFPIESERVWRFVVGSLLLVTYYFYDQLWFFPWFMGFAIFGAGLSGVCPVLLAIRWSGFR